MNNLFENLYQGNREVAIKAIQDQSVDSVLYLGQEILPELSHNPSIPVVHIPLRNGVEESPLRLEYVFEHLSYALLDDRVLVSCRLGESRSPLVCLFYLVMYNHQPYADTYSLIKSKIPEFKPDRQLFNSLSTYRRSRMYERVHSTPYL